MAVTKTTTVTPVLARAKELALPILAVSVVFVMIVPFPSWVLDFLLACSIAASILVFLTAVQVERALELSVFPTLLLLLTLFRLSLNIASSRRILRHGSEGTSAAGNVIEAFGQFVVGGNYVVGFVLFLALIAIQFLVVSHGAVRTAEVTARFTLDALPGKQMAIDADLNAGVIDELTARRRRREIAREAEFYGAMDGAARFNQRDSMATILLTVINIVAGLLIGTFQMGVPLLEAVRTYTVLTVGDGLVTMIPSLLISVAGGLILTRASSAGALGSDIEAQLLGQPKTLYLATGVLVALAFIPGLPKMTFFVAATIFAGVAFKMKDGVKNAKPKEGEAEKQKETAKNGVENYADLLRLEDLSLEIGFQLIPLVDDKQGGQLLGKIKMLRRSLSAELGFLIPPIHITDNLKLAPRDYVFLLRGSEIGRWQTAARGMLAVAHEKGVRQIPGKETREPAFGIPARWIETKDEEAAIAAGYSVVDTATVIGTHLSELIRLYAHQLIKRSEVKRLLDSVSESHPKLAEELVPKVLSLGEVQRVLQELLKERVSIRDIGTIFETMLEQAPVDKSLPQLVEQIRLKLRRSLVRPHLDGDVSLNALILDEKLEEQLQRAIRGDMDDESGTALATSSPSAIFKRVLDSLRGFIGEHVGMASPVLLCSSPGRFYLHRYLEPLYPRVTVLSPQEVSPDIRVRTLGVIR